MHAPPNPIPVELLLVEDSESDIELTRIAFERAKLMNNLNVVTDGEMALDYLHRRPPFQAAERPDLILLDLNLPKKDGREVLQEVKSDPKFAAIPIIVLTTSRDEADVLKSYELHANSFIPKPIVLDDFLQVIQDLQQYWISIVKLPS